MKAFTIPAFLILFNLYSYSQENLLCWDESKPLQWDDFSGKAKDTSFFDAESFAEVRFNYKLDQLHAFHFDVKAIFNKNISWIRQEHRSDALLKHEQIHFDIAELYARK